ncbi:hypothetical protein C2G38_2172479 [Gigaspora rosea]|uniref:Uncharacterized protein n=1 Tax=Gigaspora rosea TaxID=44941 RepID=A0A397VNY2_9GLOM|nr:hypothetical protein C2G38_2172479 [Gigaspora rosea]
MNEHKEDSKAPRISDDIEAFFAEKVTSRPEVSLTSKVENVWSASKKDEVLSTSKEKEACSTSKMGKTMSTSKAVIVTLSSIKRKKDISGAGLTGEKIK